MKKHVSSWEARTLHSPITAEDVARRLYRQCRYDVEPEQIRFPEPLTFLGLYRIEIEVSSD